MLSKAHGMVDVWGQPPDAVLCMSAEGKDCISKSLGMLCPSARDMPTVSEIGLKFP